MKKTLTKIAILMTCVGIVGCASSPFNYNKQPTVQKNKTQPKSAQTEAASEPKIGGSIRTAMDEMDTNKLSHALDKSPGKATHWVNSSSSTSYTVVPIKVVTINGNSFCRKYTITAENGGNKRTNSGTACVTNGSWKSVS